MHTTRVETRTGVAPQQTGLSYRGQLIMFNVPIFDPVVVVSETAWHRLISDADSNLPDHDSSSHNLSSGQRKVTTLARSDKLGPFPVLAVAAQGTREV